LSSSQELDPIAVIADQSRIKQVVSNLIGNAIKFTPEEGTVSVIVEMDKERNKMIVVKVIDSGKVIDLDMLPRLFTKFATKSDRGTGLGLYVSKRIIEGHGGRIWAKNNSHRRAEALQALSLVLSCPDMLMKGCLKSTRNVLSG
jgi:two-component system, OmpR family, sensor histidine kinase VicK